MLTQIEYVAIYQSINKFGRSGETGIHWYGKVTEWKVLRRKEITERPVRPGTGEELYVKFSVEKWIRKAPSIVPGGNGIKTLLFTSKYIFDRAQEIAELRLETEEELNTWREERRRGPITVELNHDQVDLASAVVDIRLREDYE